ncbi:DegV family protein [Clostridium sp. P21]|uniref:DegV family protein n=1 Tax=Clostridium muellerianum TaxID=2716538 RepID=A0A7Y0HP59_9CLOT|nr:DegV family protein [Clostridium muellerianum]NMM62716.1 DegV family protein [Clostridium muellerianum]
MEKILLITDSASDINKDFIKKNNIKLLPFKITFKDMEYEDGIDINSKMLYEMLPNEIPKTSLPSIDRLSDILEKGIKEGYTHAIIVTISNQFSGTYNSVRLFCDNFQGLKIHVFDSLSLTMAEGAIITESVELIKAGKSFEQIVNVLPKIRDNTEVFFTIDTLEYLKKGGRIGKVAGTVGEILNLKPIITIDKKGAFQAIFKVRGVKQSISKLTSIAKSKLEMSKCKVWILSGDAKEKALTLYESIRHLPNLIECKIEGEICPALGINTGKGLVGFVVETID